MNEPATTHTGPSGSAIHVLRAGTVAEPAVVDWSRRFRRACLDPRGVVTPVAPSLHTEEEAYSAG